MKLGWFKSWLIIRVGEWIKEKAVLRIVYSNKKAAAKVTIQKGNVLEYTWPHDSLFNLPKVKTRKKIKNQNLKIRTDDSSDIRQILASENWTDPIVQNRVAISML